MKVHLLRLNEVYPRSGRLYSPEVIQKAIDNHHPGKPMWGVLWNSTYETKTQKELMSVQLEDIGYILNNLRIENSDVVADLELRDTPHGNMIRLMLSEDFTPGPTSVTFRLMLALSEHAGEVTRCSILYSAAIAKTDLASQFFGLP